MCPIFRICLLLAVMLPINGCQPAGRTGLDTKSHPMTPTTPDPIAQPRHIATYRAEDLHLLADTTIESGQLMMRASQEPAQAADRVLLPEGLLEPGGRYAVRVRYQHEQTPADRSHFAYLAIRSRAGGGKWFPTIELFPSVGQWAQSGYDFTIPADGHTYRIWLGIQGTIALRVDTVEVWRLPHLADGLPDSPPIDAPLSGPFEPYGLCAHAERLWQYTDQMVEQAVPMWAAAGVQWVRIEMNWGSFEPFSHSGWNQAQVARMDRLLELCEQHGIRPYAIIYGIPRWASSNPWDNRHWAYPPVAMDRFADFVRFIAKRYGRHINYWELGNEPNWIFWMGDIPTYMRWAKTAAEVIRAEDPGARIISGGLADAGIFAMRIGPHIPKPTALQEMVDHGFRETFDIFAVHLYAIDPKEMIHQLNAVHAQLRALGLDDLPIWVTETGFSTADGRTEQQQAEWITEAYELLVRHPLVDKVFYYNFRRKVEEAAASEQEAGFGLVAGDLKPRPGYHAFATMPRRGLSDRQPGLLAIDRWMHNPPAPLKHSIPPPPESHDPPNRAPLRQ